MDQSNDSKDATRGIVFGVNSRGEGGVAIPSVKNAMWGCVFLALIRTTRPQWPKFDSGFFWFIICVVGLRSVVLGLFLVVCVKIYSMEHESRVYPQVGIGHSRLRDIQ